MFVFDEINLETVWKKVKNDYGNEYWSEVFIDHPYLLEIMESKKEEWFTDLKRRINDYKPKPAPVIDTPKKNFGTRPAAILDIEDHLVYSTLILNSVEKIKEVLSWSAKDTRFSHILLKKQSGKRWFEPVIQNWLLWKNSAAELSKEYEYAVFGDVTGFYENIDIKLLISDLKDTYFKKGVLELLNHCLHTWSGPVHRGLPQGYSPSNILAEIYMNSIDKKLHQYNIKYLRYVDDFIILCDNHQEAQETLNIFNRLLREKGLNINTAKSGIKTQNEAIEQIKGVEPIINNISKDIQTKLQYVDYYGNPYNPDIKSYVTQKHLVKTFKEFFIEKKEFHSTLFHYLMNRIHSSIAVDYCINMLTKRPEETKYCLRYLAMVHRNYYDITNTIEAIFQEISQYNQNEYQKYQITKWLYNNKIISNEIIRIIKQLYQSETQIPHLKDYYAAYLIQYGNLTEILESYDEPDEITRNTIKYAFRDRMTIKNNNSIESSISAA